MTVSWWDDVWLNEAFASWLATKLLNEWKPEWNLKAERAQSTSVFRADSLASARKIRQPIESAGDIANAFDGITYGKGQAVLNMFENYVGEASFQRAVKLYLSKHQWATATSSDLLASIDKVSPQSGAGTAMSTFLNQTGFPLITVTEHCRGTPAAPSIQITQTRFAPVGAPHGQPSTWQVPICVSWSNGKSIHRQCNLLTEQSGTFRLRDAKGCPAWLSADSNAAGYYAIAYESGLARSLVERGMKELSAAERAALLRSTQLLFSVGLGNPEQELALISEFGRGSDAQFLRQSAQIASDVGRFVSPDDRIRYANWIRQLYSEKARELGWRSRPGKSPDVQRLRMRVVPLAATQGNDAELREEAGKLARQWLKEKSGLDPDMVAPVLATAAWDGNREFFNELVSAIRQDKVQRERQWMIEALSAFRDPELVRASLDLFLQPGIDQRELGGLPFDSTDDTRQFVWDFARNHFDQLNAVLPSARGVPYGAYLPMVASGFCDGQHRDEVHRFFRPRMKRWKVARVTSPTRLNKSNSAPPEPKLSVPPSNASLRLITNHGEASAATHDKSLEPSSAVNNCVDTDHRIHDSIAHDKRRQDQFATTCSFGFAHLRKRTESLTGCHEVGYLGRRCVAIMLLGCVVVNRFQILSRVHGPSDRHPLALRCS